MPVIPAEQSVLQRFGMMDWHGWLRHREWTAARTDHRLLCVGDASNVMIDRMKSSTETPQQPAKVRRPGTRAVASLLPQVTAKALGKRGFGQAGLVTDWPEIVGADVARWVVPERLSFPRGARTGATLQVRVAGAAALEVQHAAPSIVERINHYLGHAAVARLAIRQGPVPGPAQMVARKEAAGPTTPTQSAWVDARLAKVPDGDLKAALAGLGRALARDHGVADEPDDGTRRPEIEASSRGA